MHKSGTDTTRTTSVELSWADGQPFSRQFDDVYFSSANGLEESRYVFLQHNHLAKRWQSLPERGHFTIGETGFGTGLNFLAAAELWLNTAPATATLHFVSVEKFPLNRSDLTQALALWPQLAPLAEQLVAAYPLQPEQEIYPIAIANGRVKLTLMIGEAVAALRHQEHRQHPQFTLPKMRIDAWFLDGFAPAKNPDMWSPALFQQLVALSQPGTSLATFTSAGSVRRGLQAAGFQTEKAKGFGQKREMLTALLPHGTPEAATAPCAASAPADHPKPKSPWAHTRCQPAGRRALVIGAGIAGSHTAHALAKRGWQVIVVDAGSGPANGASGNAQGVVYAKLSPQRHPQGRFNLAALQFALNTYGEFWTAQPEHGAPCGVLQLAHEKDTEAEQRAALATLPSGFARWMSAPEASAQAGLALSEGGTWLPSAGWLNPTALCHWLLQHPNIQTQFNAPVQTLNPQPAGRWSAATESGELEADLVVVACAHHALQFPQCNHLPLKAIRGQVTRLPSQPPLAPLRCVITREGYTAPLYEGQHSVGATFNLKDTRTDLCPIDHQTNLQTLRSLLPELEDIDQDALSGRVGFRCTAPDYLPIAGPVPNAEAMTDIYAGLRRNARAAIAAAPAYWPNLLINTAHGSRGLAYTPLCAEWLASIADNSPWPLHPDLALALHPARFLMRDIARRKR
ncbi:bifunctional tRNA (5-methylaminomethyl-2-thiouridine)(34)-methyltransferase MnmD/FAD-dependent 5-carboxymethylaminomethyl-2-thiouridine(34) oxidoreductase MnmC [Simiduia aestuariiviva]|uniref:tRNA 5-methylaminomethyl-2-thiouridine biosynthesis bifunctional protein MnmC n=1 Tax=Simiduia aestuariiviva TaxID=1510459 RepID=A0A839UM42_9GAMM|nr:tRNA 5-methylaminomethyl-2-thiouridine biosynthesis bifunctional protein [Simiduia aestuariiviva]